MSKAIGVHIHGRDESELRIPPTAWSHEGFRAWVCSNDFPETGIQATYVDGEVLIDMSPEESEGHNKVKKALVRALDQLTEEEELGELYFDRMLLSHPDAGLSCEPDVLFFTWATLESGRLRRIAKSGHTDRFVEFEGTPDLVVEVVSDSSVQKDLRLLRDAYYRAGIPEYWLIDARGDAVRFEILHRSDIGYHAAAASDAPQRSHVLGRTFTLSRTRNRVGGFRYHLTTVG